MRLFKTLFIPGMLLALAGLPLEAQDRLPKLPGYEQYQKTNPMGSVKMGTVSGSWKEDGKYYEYSWEGKKYRFDLVNRTKNELTEAEKSPVDSKPGGKTVRVEGRRGRSGTPEGSAGQVERGRQYTSSTSPDSKWKAVYKDRNLWLYDAKENEKIQLTLDGSEKDRIKYGTASWVYGEELYQNSAMWWSPDSKRIAYYRFDESKVPDYYLTLSQLSLQSKIDAEPYPKAGKPNPVVDLFVYDLEAKKSVKIDIREGKEFTNDSIGHYVYAVKWSPKGDELFFNRTNRRQNIMEFTAANPATGKCRVIVREEWPASWTDNTPAMRYLEDKNRFIWVSFRNGFKNFYLYDLSGKLHATITNHDFEVANIVRVDEKANTLYYMARDGDNAMKLQLHRCSLDGKNDKRLTDPKYLHSIDLAPDGKHFVDTYQTHDQPAATRIVDSDAQVVAELAKPDMSKFNELGLKKVELINYKAADGVTELHGMLHFPSHFDPNKKYPMLLSVYGGPETNGARETFVYPNRMTEYGFLVVELDSRSAAGRGKKFLDAIYLKLGVTEIDDLAAGVKSLWNRPYFDKTKVGVFGTSYGGYVSAMCILRHPEVFHAACAASAVTDWRLYDSIYTERYMWLPDEGENKKGYDAGNAMNYAKNLKGRLMIFFGTADNNVHPSNSMQLIRSLQSAGKNFEVQVGPDQGHAGINPSRMMEFFIENLGVGK